MANRHCHIHTEKRHPGKCRYCTADTSGRIPLASQEDPSRDEHRDAHPDQPELFPLEEVKPKVVKVRVTAEPPPPTKGRWGRGWKRAAAPNRIAAIVLIALLLCGLLLVSSGSAQPNRAGSGERWSAENRVAIIVPGEGGQ